ncbi:MAG: TonB-dependent receptor family protein [Cyclobacteriaceae bacterium]|nr:TonB-dependent receptor family protein [Cyclobacteriaceae bacterium]
MRIVITLTVIFIGQIAWAQKFVLKGQLADSAGAPLGSATVLLLNPKDSSLVNFAASNSRGYFEMKNINRADYLFKVTYVGYLPLTVHVSPRPEEGIVDLGLLKMEVDRRVLDEITIRAERAPVVIKKDTIEFNAASFRTKPNAVVEDLLKQMPSIEVDNDGTIRAQGEQVQQVTVDGREFFGRDPKLATRNLPADAVDKVQVFDKKSDQAAFTGIDDGQRTKTINLELKEEKRNGAFGSMMAGAGNDERFTSRLSLNRFSKGSQFSILGMGNNINEQGFSIDDYMNFSGGSQQMMSGGAVRLSFGSDNDTGIPLNFGGRNNGMMTNFGGGVNLNKDFGKHRTTQVNGSYFYNYLNHELVQNTFRENFLPNNQSFNFDQLSSQYNTNSNHRANLILDHQIDSMNSVKWTTNFTFNETDSEVKSLSATFTPEGTLQNESDRLSLSAGTTYRLNSTLLYRHRFNKKGRSFSTNLTLGLTDTERNGALNATNTFYIPVDSINTIEQRNYQKNDNQNYGVTFTYTEPLGKRKYLEGNYSLSNNRNQVIREVFDIENESEVVNNLLSNSFSSDYLYQRAGLNFRMNRTKFNITAGVAYQQTNLDGDLNPPFEDISRTFSNVLPVVRFNYNFSGTKHLNFDYETSVQEPTIQQLQPVIDNTDPLNIYVGNPGLRPAYNQSWRVNFTTFDPVSFVSFFAFVDVDYTTNAITNAQFINDQLVRTTVPVNVSGNFRAMGNASFSFQAKKINSRFTIGTNVRNLHTISILNDTENEINQWTKGGNFRYSYRYKEVVDLSLSAQLNHQKTRYEFDQPTQSNLNQTYASELNLSFLKNYQFNAGFEYLVYQDPANDFRQTIPLLNLSLSRFLLKNKTGELKFLINNVLDKALGISQSATNNYFERTISNSLGQYYMITFTYALNKHLNPMGMRRGGGMMRVIRQ